MPQLMAEAFARDLVDKIMVETFDILESIMQQDNSPVEIGSAEISSQSVHSRLQMHVDCDENATEEPVERDVKIGEPSSALCSLTILEEQVKRTARSIHDALLSDTIETTETYVIQGQGDVDEIICDAVIETRTQSIEPINTKEKEIHSISEAASVSTNLLHHMIKELETNLNDTTLGHDSNPESIREETSSSDREYNKKTEGSLVRSVENAKNLEQISSAIPTEVESMIHSENVNIEKPKKPSPLLTSTSLVKNICLEEVAIKESQSSSSSPSTMRKNVASATLAFTSEQDIRDAASSSELKSPNKESGKKSGFFSRMRKVLRVAFSRRKN